MTDTVVINIPPWPPECAGWVVECGIPRAGDWFLSSDDERWENALSNSPNSDFKMVLRNPTPTVFDSPNSDFRMVARNPTPTVETVGDEPVTLISTEERGQFSLVGYTGEGDAIYTWTREGRLRSRVVGTLDLTAVEEEVARLRDALEDMVDDAEQQGSPWSAKALAKARRVLEGKA